MRRGTKFLLKSALVFGVVGAGFGLAGLCLGFTMGDFYAAVDSGRLTLPQTAAGPVAEEVSGLLSSAQDYSADFADVSYLELNAGTVSCTLIPWENRYWRVTGSGLPAGFSCEAEKGGELEISCESGFLSFLNFWRIDDGGSAQLYLYYPENAVLEELDLEAGVGEIRTEGMIRCNYLQLECGVGDCSLEADIRKEGVIECGVGEISLTLAGRRNDYNYDLGVGVGEIVLQGVSYSGLGRGQIIDNKAGCDLSIDGGVGSIEIMFEEE